MHLRFFDNRLMRSKLVWAFSAILAVTLGLGGFSAWRLALLAGDTAKIESSVTSLQQLAIVAKDADAVAFYSVNLPSLANHMEMLSEQSLEQAANKEGASQLANYAASADAGTEAANAAVIGAAYKKLDDTFAANFNQLNNGNWSGGDQGMGDATKNFHAAMLTDMNFLHAQDDAYTREARRTMRSGYIGIAAVIAAVVALSGLIVLMLLGSVARPIADMTDVMRRLSRNDTSVEIPGAGRGDEIGAMAAAVQVFKENALRRAKLEHEAEEFQHNLDIKLKDTQAAFEASGREQKDVMESMAGALAALAQGDLTARFTREVSAAYAALRNDFNAAVDNLQKAMQSVSANTQGVRAAAAEITHSTDDLSRRTEQQAASLEETAAALDEITATVRKTAQGANEARSVVNEAKADAERSGKVVNETVAAMGGIEASAKQIANIIVVIDEIAFQTNLLALNAGVEAARAGDAGRGFAVVATEVRALAQRSADAAKEIKALISTSGAQVETGVKLVGETGHALARIVAQVTKLNALVADIAASAQEQATGLNEVNSAVNQMDQVTQQNAAMVEETTAASHALSAEAEELARLVTQFRIGEVQPAAQTGGPPRRPAMRRPAPARHDALVEEF